ncbi:MAG: hypothetical protein O4804_19690, partial [Trichodesmium sp. St11_bin5]|nr:hypothetical protein [Trichodesmium sp. St11_bin5]
MTNAFKSIAGTELPVFAQDLLTTLGGLANLNIELNDNGFGVTYVGELNISSTINSLLSTLGWDVNVLSEPLSVTNPGLRVTKDDTGKKISVSIGEFSPTEVIGFLGDTLGVELPNNISEQLNKLGNASLSLSSQGIFITYLDDITFDLNDLIGDSFTSLSLVVVEEVVNNIGQIVFGDRDNNKPGTQVVLAEPEFKITEPGVGVKSDDIRIDGLLNDKEFRIGLNDDDGLNFEYKFDTLNLNSILGEIPGLDGFQLDKTKLSFSQAPMSLTLEGNVDFEKNNNVLSKFINGFLEIDNVDVALKIDTQSLLLKGNLLAEDEDVPLISIGDFKATLNDFILKAQLELEDAKVGILNKIKLEGYDPSQEEEPPLTVTGEFAVSKVDPIFPLIGSFKLDPDEVWENPFGLPDSELRSVGIEIRGGAIKPFISNVGFVGDLKFGNYDFDSAFSASVDGGNPVISLTLNEPLHLYDIMAGPIKSYLIKQLSSVPILDKVTEVFNSFRELVPITVVSIDGPDNDRELDPLIKIADETTNVLGKTIKQGIEFNAGVTVGNKEGTLNFNFNPFPVVNPNPLAQNESIGLEGSLKIPEIDVLGVVKISGVPNGKDTDLNLDLKVSPSEAYFRGDGIIELFGIEAAKAEFNISTSGIEVSELSLGPLKLLDAYIKKSDGGIVGN